MQSCLLDKNVVRRAIEGIAKTSVRQILTQEEFVSLRLLFTAEQTQIPLFISIETHHILERYGPHPDIEVFRRFVRVLYPARYFKRWAHRLRQHGFTREDAKVLALATFGSDLQGTFLGIEQIATFDQPFVNHVQNLRGHLTHRLQSMTGQLPLPYHWASLPVVSSPHVLLSV